MVFRNASGAARRLANSSAFNQFILAVIVLNAVLIGIETYLHHPILIQLERICMAIFIAEIGLKFCYSDSKRVWLADGWNWFDVLIVGSALVPNVSQVVSVLHIMPLVKNVPELRMIVHRRPCAGQNGEQNQHGCR